MKTVLHFKIFPLVLLIFLLKLPASLSMEGETKTYHAGPLAFEAPVGYLKVEDLGPSPYAISAYTISLAEEDPKIKNAWITLIFKSKAQVSQLPPGTLLSHFKISLGASNPAEKQVTREILKKKITGDWQHSKIPHPLTLEAYEITLSDGSTVFVAFRKLESFSADKAEKFFNLFSMTLRENTPKTK